MIPGLDDYQPTPPDLASALLASGWTRLSRTDWQRPGAHSDAHSWPVAQMIHAGEPSDWLHIPMPPPRKPRPGVGKHPWRARRRAPRKPKQLSHLPA